MNSAIEYLIDHMHSETAPEIKLAKDIGAAAVLLASFGALTVAGLLACLSCRRFAALVDRSHQRDCANAEVAESSAVTPQIETPGPPALRFLPLRTRVIVDQQADLVLNSKRNIFKRWCKVGGTLHSLKNIARRPVPATEISAVNTPTWIKTLSIYRSTTLRLHVTFPTHRTKAHQPQGDIRKQSGARNWPGRRIRSDGNAFSSKAER
jgi:hypothetical protein